MDGEWRPVLPPSEPDPPPVPAPHPARQLLALAGRWLGDHLVAERERWFLWVPVAIGVGIVLYFSLPIEPPLWSFALSLPILVGAGVVTAWQMTRRLAVALSALALSLLCLGFAAAQIRTLIVAAPVLAERFGPGWVSGQVAEIEAFPGGLRLVLTQPRLDGVSAEATPGRIRLTYRFGRTHDPVPIAVGDRLLGRAILLPPQGPVSPGAFDFSRYAWFQGLGATGFTLGPPERLGGGRAGPPSLFASPAAWLETRRLALAEGIRARYPDKAGAMAAAFLTGKRRAIPEAPLEAMRDAGLAHLLAISGLHIGLVAAFLFTSLRLALSLIPPLALRFPIKKIAASVALLGALAYLMLAGATVPTLRAFLMIALALLATLVDRTGLSMRVVAWGASVILLLEPESLLGASFQMSFAAVVALVAAYEGLRALSRRRGWALWGREAGMLRRLPVYFATVALTSLIAGLATAPFALYHFNEVARYGLAANLAAVPLMAFWIMPMGVGAMLAMPFGGEGPMLAGMVFGVGQLITIAETIAALPGATQSLPAWPVGAMGLMAGGGLWLCLWRQRWRWGGGVVILLGLGLALGRAPPDLLVSADGEPIAVRTEAGELAFSSRYGGRILRETWLRRVGEQDPTAWPAQDGEPLAPLPGLRCDPLGCVLERNGHALVWSRFGDGLAEDCRRATVLITPYPLRKEACPGPALILDRRDLRRARGLSLWLDEGALRLESVADRQGMRPWSMPQTFKSGS